MPRGRRPRFGLALGVSVALLSSLATGADARGLMMAGNNSGIEIHMGVLDALPPASGSEGPVIHLHMPVYRRARIRRPIPLPLAPPLALEAELVAKPAAKPSQETTGESSPTAPAEASPSVTVTPAARTAATPPEPSSAGKTPQATAANPQSTATATASQPAATKAPAETSPSATAATAARGAATTPETSPAGKMPQAMAANPQSTATPVAPTPAAASSGGGIQIGGALGGGMPQPPSETRMATTAAPPAAMAAPAPKIALSIPFGANQSTLSPKAQTELSKLAAELAGNNERIELKAYAAQSAADGARMLSLTRALAVRAYLMNKGVADTRIDVRALGAAASGPPDRVDIRSLAE